ncbi:hypothetical protein [Alteraurantiacibacter palmitatis]|uniref:Uncharacterized protein n=1 Tax=Alteraurantiacibacter palmitatis TaxID=2054628 RepID=A0ABV7E1Z5_9SPHN
MGLLHASTCFRPGHPLYERIRAEVLADLALRNAEDEESVLAELCLRLEQMREREAEMGPWAQVEGRDPA